MKVIAKYKDYSFDKDNNILISFTVDNRYIEQVVKLENTNDDKFIELKISDRVAQKSARQNRAVWKLISMMSEKMNGRATSENINELYCQLIKMAGIKLDHLQGLVEIEKQLNTFYRVVEVRERRTAENGAETCMYECYRGLSQFDKQETNQFIETILDYAGKLGLGISLESEELRSMLGKKE